MIRATRSTTDNDKPFSQMPGSGYCFCGTTRIQCRPGIFHQLEGWRIETWEEYPAHDVAPVAPHEERHMSEYPFDPGRILKLELKHTSIKCSKDREKTTDPRNKPLCCATKVNNLDRRIFGYLRNELGRRTAIPNNSYLLAL